MLMKKVRKSLGFSKKNNVFLIILIIIFIVVSCLLGYTIYLRNNISKNINQNITKEYGQTITINDIVKKGYNKKVKVSSDLNKITDVGKHKIILTIEGQKFTVTINIKDTTPPTLEVKNLEMYVDEDIPKVSDFVIKLDDLSEVKLDDIDIDKTVGEHDINIVARDEYGNESPEAALALGLGHPAGRPDAAALCGHPRLRRRRHQRRQPDRPAVGHIGLRDALDRHLPLPLGGARRGHHR